MLFFRYFSLLNLLIFLSSCSGNQLLENRFAPDSALNLTAKPNQTAQINQPTKPVELPQDFPQDIPPYPQAELIEVNENKTLWSSSDPSNLIINYYEQNLTNLQWQIEQKEDNLIKAKKPESQQNLLISLSPEGENTNFTIAYNNLNNENDLTNNSSTSITPIDNTPSNLNLENSPLQELISLNIIDNSTQEINPYQIINRREYARWLVKANNLLYADSNGKQIRLANPNSKPIFTDINNNDPDFAVIQGLAEAGLIPSSLTQDSNALNFRPDAPLTREDLIAWKIPLDFRQNLPTASLDSIKETWGFQDASQIKPQIWQKLYVDWQNGEDSNVKRAFGYITLFQPQKPVTYEEVARVLQKFGSQGEIRPLNQIKQNNEQ